MPAMSRTRPATIPAHAHARTALALNDCNFVLQRRKVEVDGDEALPRAGLQVLQHALIAWVVRDHELKARRGLEGLAGLVDGQHVAMIGERMQDHHSILTRLNDFIEIADRSIADGSRQRAVLPVRAIVAYQEAANQYDPVHVDADIQRLYARLQQASLLLTQGKRSAAEPLLLEVMSYPFYNVSHPQESATRLRDFYLEAARNLIEARRGNLAALKDIHLFPMAEEEIGPILKEAITQAEKK